MDATPTSTEETHRGDAAPDDATPEVAVATDGVRRHHIPVRRHHIPVEPFGGVLGPAAAADDQTMQEAGTEASDDVASTQPRVGASRCATHGLAQQAHEMRIANNPLLLLLFLGLLHPQAFVLRAASARAHLGGDGA